MKIAYSWFNRDRGSNDYEDYQSVIIFGSFIPDDDELTSVLNTRYIKPVSNRKENRIYQDQRFFQGIAEQQHHEIKQCIHRVRPINNPRQAFLFFSDFSIDGLEVNRKIEAKEWSGEALSEERLDDFQVYTKLVEGVVEKLGFYTPYFQSHLDKMKILVTDEALVNKMEHLTQNSKYGKSFSRLGGGGKHRKDLEQIITKLKLSKARLRFSQNWQKTKTWSYIYCSPPKKDRIWELSTNQIIEVEN